MEPFRTLAAVALLACTTQAFAIGGLADLIVYDRTEGRRLPVHWHEGRAYVAGKPGNEYQVTVRNNLREDLLAVVSVDGVNILSGETADPAQGGYLLSPRRALDMQGWRKSLSETAAFYFTSLGDSYAGRTGRPDNVGVIGVALFKRKQEPRPLAQVAPAAPGARKEASSDSAGGPLAESGSGANLGADARGRAPAAQERIGTGHGRRETSHVQLVAFERASLAPTETIAIYYDSHRNLVARGIVRETPPLAVPLPRPFPGFVPDPA